MKETIKILFVEDVLADAELNWREIEKSGIIIDKLLVDTREAYLEGLTSFAPDLIISDYSLPQFDGMTALSLRNELTPLIPFILVTGSINEEVAVECMKAGADDYVVKENLARLGQAVVNSINKFQLIKQKEFAERELVKSEKRLQKAQSIAHVGNWELDLSLKMLWGSAEALRIYGLDPESHEVPLDVVQKIVVPEFRPILDEALDRLLKYNEPYEAEFKIIRKNDSAERWVFSKAEILLTSEDKKLNIIGVIQDITEHKDVEKALRDGEERYRSIFENVQDLYYESSLDGTILEVSPSIFTLSHGQYKRKDLLGKSMSDFYTFSQEREQLIKILKAKGRISDFEITLKNRDGSLIPCSVSAIFSFDAQKNPIKIIGSMRDISKRKKAEKTLQDIIDKNPMSIQMMDIDGFTLKVNQAFVKLFGSVPPPDFSMFEDIQLKEKGFAELLVRIKNREVVQFPDMQFNPHDSLSEMPDCLSWIKAIGFALEDSNGKPEKIVLMHENITERKLAEEKLRQSSEFNESLLKTIPFGMDIVDEEGNILFQSDNFKRIFGESSLGKKCWELYRDDKKQCADCPLFKGITVGETEAYESHGVLGNRIFEISHTGMMYKGKKAMLEIFQDITDRKQTEEDLIYAKNKAEESDNLKTAFLHNISHEIRTPMNAIVGFSALLGEPDLDAQSRQDYIEVIVQSSNHLLEIITDIVDISNIEANLVKVVKNEINVNSTLKSLYNQFMPKANEKNVKLIFETTLSDSEALILTDSTKLNQVLINLISNALKFTSDGSIIISYKIKDAFMEFCVKDTGIGIAEEFHDKIFERFYQVLHSYSKLYEGTGLGLAISKANIELMGGKIWLSSEPGAGSTFYFTIPYEKRFYESKIDDSKSPTEYQAFTEKKKILVAEDIESNFKLISYFLSGSNTEIIRAVNGKEAVEKCLLDKNIDLILMDIKMPVMDGYTAIKLIREKDSTIPIITQTAYFDDKEPAMQAGSSGFISKPFDRKGLLKIMHEFI